MSYSANWRDLISRFGYGFVNDLEQYKFIVKTRAYADMQPRTIGGLGKFREDSENKENLDSLFNEVAEKLYSFVIKDPVKSREDFDKWHKEICESFVEKFNKITEGFPVEKIAFGKGQKLINCSLKYIYCLKDADKFEKKFEHCHMILDRYTYSEGFYKEKVAPWCKEKKTGLLPWSKLDCKKYYEIQQNIRKYLEETKNYKEDSGTSLTPFQTEFFVFDEYQKSRASKESKAEQ